MKDDYDTTILTTTGTRGAWFPPKLAGMEWEPMLRRVFHCAEAESSDRTSPPPDMKRAGGKLPESSHRPNNKPV